MATAEQNFRAESQPVRFLAKDNPAAKPQRASTGLNGIPEKNLSVQSLDKDEQGLVRHATQLATG